MSMKKLYAITIKGTYKTWSLNVWAEPEWVEDWRTDGLEVYEIVYSIPDWIVSLGLMRIWIFCSDIFNFRNPLRKKDD